MAHDSARGAQMPEIRNQWTEVGLSFATHVGRRLQVNAFLKTGKAGHFCPPNAPNFYTADAERQKGEKS